MRQRFLHLFLAALAVTAAAPCVAAAQSANLFKLRAGSPAGERFRVDSTGAFVAFGFMRDVGNTNGCAAFLPASGAGTRFQWDPCRGSVRFGRVPVAQTNWDDANNDDFTFAGGNQVTANGYGAFAYGDQVTVTGTVGVGFGSGVTVSGTAGFSSGASNVCSGFACTAIGYTVRAGGQGSVALGYRTTANNDYAVAIGYRATNNGFTGTLVLGDETNTDSVRNQANNEFRARYSGGFRLRVSAAANGNVPGAGGNAGCDLTAAVPSWTCASSRDMKRGFEAMSDEEILTRLAAMPVTRWQWNSAKDSVRHMGPVAEDFYSAFGLGASEHSVVLSDLSGVALASAKALERRTRELTVAQAALTAGQARAEQQAARIATLESQLREVQAAERRTTERLAAMDAALARLAAPPPR